MSDEITASGDEPHVHVEPEVVPAQVIQFPGHKPVRPVPYGDPRFHSGISLELLRIWDAEDAGTTKPCIRCSAEAGEEIHRPLTWFAFSRKQIEKHPDRPPRARASICVIHSHPEGALDPTQLTDRQMSVVHQVVTTAIEAGADGIKQALKENEDAMPALMRQLRTQAEGGNTKAAELVLRYTLQTKQTSQTETTDRSIDEWIADEPGVATDTK